MMDMLTGKTIMLQYDGRELVLCNQRCRQWVQPYGYLDEQCTLSQAGCGIFSVVNASCYMTGIYHDPDELARFSLKYGGRGDDGTDRPKLLHAMMEQGIASDFGFRYDEDGLRNDLPTLAAHLDDGGTALANLRVGHIVALLAHRVCDGEQQVLAADPYSESADSRILDHVREVIPGSEIISSVTNKEGLNVGKLMSYSLFWVSMSIVRDFNLLHRVEDR